MKALPNKEGMYFYKGNEAHVFTSIFGNLKFSWEDKTDDLPYKISNVDRTDPKDWEESKT